MKKHESDVISIIKIKNKDLLISIGYDKKLIIWNLNSYKVIKEINNVHCTFINGLKEIPNHRVIISGEKDLFIFDYEKMEIIKQIITENKVTCLEIINERLLLCGCFDGSYLDINLEDLEMKKKDGKEGSFISSMMKIKNDVIAVGLHNGKLKIYKC